MVVPQPAAKHDTAAHSLPTHPVGWGTESGGGGEVKLVG